MKWSHRSDLNRGPAVYETAALPLSYGGVFLSPNQFGYEWSRRSESNRGPVVYKTTALPLSYGGLFLSRTSFGEETFGPAHWQPPHTNFTRDLGGGRYFEDNGRTIMPQVVYLKVRRNYALWDIKSQAHRQALLYDILWCRTT